jgi:hypothetical protein
MDLRDDIQHTATQLCKAVKELSAVRNALVSLQRREEPNPSPLNTAESLSRIGDRLRDTAKRYRPFKDRLEQLTACELLPSMSDMRLMQPTAACRRCQPAAPDKRPRAVDDKRPEADVCAEETGIRRVENRQCLSLSYDHDQCLRRTMHRDMVEYLLRTNRRSIALLVAKHYGVPLHYFEEPREIRAELSKLQLASNSSCLLLHSAAYPRLGEIGRAKEAGAAAEISSAIQTSSAATNLCQTLEESSTAASFLSEAISAGDDTARVEAFASSAELMERIVHLVSAVFDEECLSGALSVQSERNRSCCTNSSESARKSYTSKLTEGMRCGQSVLLSLRCTELLLLHRLRERGPVEAHVCSPSRVLSFIADRLLPLAAVDDAALIPSVIARVSKLRPDAGVQPSAAAPGGQDAGSARVASEARERSICQQCDGLLSAAGLVDRFRNCVVGLQQAMEELLRWRRAQCDARLPAPHLVARVVAAALQNADHFLDSILLAEQSLQCALCVGSAVQQLQRLTVKDILGNIEKTELAPTRTDDEVASVAEAGRCQQRLHRTLEAFDAVFTRHFAPKLVSRLVCVVEGAASSHVDEANEGGCKREKGAVFFAMPTGYIVSTRGLARLVLGERQADASDGRASQLVTCPVTGEQFQVIHLRRLFLM